MGRGATIVLADAPRENGFVAHSENLHNRYPKIPTRGGGGVRVFKAQIDGMLHAPVVRLQLETS